MNNEYFNLIDTFNNIYKTSKRDPTFLEISGYPHYENVCSNILSFFLDPTKEHQLSDLVCKSMLDCIGVDSKLSNISIDREVGTDKGRIDLLIFSDEYLIVIENKIFHTPNNPFEDYIKKAKELSGNRKVIFILLGLQKTEDLLGFGFKSITYSDFFKNIRSGIGNHIEQSNNKYLVFLIEFMKSIENIISGGNMDKNLVYFFDKYEKEAIQFVKSFNQFRIDLRNKVIEVKGLIDPSIVKKQALYRDSGELFDCLFHDLTVDNQTIAIDCTIKPKGWEITIFVRSGYSMESLEKSLTKRNVNFKKHDRFIYENIYPFETSTEKIAKILSDLIKKLSSPLLSNK